MSARQVAGVPPFIYKMIMDLQREVKALRESPLPFDLTLWVDGRPVSASFYSPDDRIRLGLRALDNPRRGRERRLL